MSGTGKTIEITNHLPAYKSFYSQSWGEEINRLGKGTPFHIAAINLVEQFKSASYCHSLPYLFMHQIPGFYDAFNKTAIGDKWIRSVGVQRVLVASQDPLLTPEIINTVGEVLRASAAPDIVDETRRAAMPTPEQIWEEYVNNFGFIFMLRLNQRHVFSSLYYAYEDYLMSVWRCATGTTDLPKYKPHPMTGQCEKFLKLIFGDAVTAACWSAPEISIARDARNCIAHRGGRVDESNEEKFSQSFRVIDGELQFKPEDSLALYNLLTERSLMFLNAAVRRESKMRQAKE